MKRNRVEKNTDHTHEALIIEDEVDICFLLQGILKKKKLRTTFVNNIHQAQDILSETDPGILFLDNNLPDGQGIDMIPNIKSHHPSTRIVVITADDTAVNRSRALAAGADFFIGKPFTMDTINRAVDTMMMTA